MDHFGCQLAAILDHFGIKILGFWGLGASGGASGSHVGPHGRPEGPKWPKTDEKAHPWASLLGTVFGTFSDFGQFFWRPGPQSVFGRLLASGLEGFGIIFGDIFWICWVTFSMRSRKWKTWFGLIICYESSTWAFADPGGQIPKICDFGGTFLAHPLGRHFGAFWVPCWFHFGTILEPKWLKHAVQKSTEKKVRKKSCECLQVSASVGGVGPLKSYNWRVGGSYNTLQSLHWCLGGTVADYTFCAR